MKIVPSQETNADPNLVSVTREAWQKHPLRTAQSDQLLEKVTLVVEEGDSYGLNANRHPEYRLVCAPDSTSSSIPRLPAIIHELTHLIDRFDPQFIGERSPEEARQEIEAIPRGNPNESIKDAFDTYWNAYIDGRLKRRDITVHNLTTRMDEKLGSRGREGEVLPGEWASLEQIWNDEPHTLDELIQLAHRFPNRRAKKYWLDYPEDGA